MEAAARRRQPPDDEAADVVAVAGHRRPHGLGDDRHRRAEGVRLRRARSCGRATSRRTTAGSASSGATPRRRCCIEDALYVQVLHGMHTDDPSYLLRIDKATGKTVWRVERPTQRALRVAGRLHDAGAAAVRRRHRDRDHRRRRRHRPRSGDRQGAVARRRPQSRATTAATASSPRRWCTAT